MDTTKENALREQSVHFKTPRPDYSATLNIEPMFVSGFGQFHTNEPAAENPNKKLTPYVTIDLPGIRALVDNPQSVDKAEIFTTKDTAKRTIKQRAKARAAAIASETSHAP